MGHRRYDLGVWRRAEKNFAKLMEYEHRLEELFSKRRELCGICQYHLDTLPHAAARGSLADSTNAIFINSRTLFAPINAPHFVNLVRGTFQ